jgi:hypothetical protein
MSLNANLARIEFTLINNNDERSLLEFAVPFLS